MRSQHRSSGFSLLEVLLVCAIIAVLSIVIIRSFHSFTVRSAQTEMKSDEQTIFNALNLYYHQTACTAGVFPAASVDVDLIGNGTISASALHLFQPSSVVTGYQAIIHNTGQRQNSKPIYAFQVKAVLATGLSASAITYYANTLSAQISSDSTQLIWNAIPSFAAPGAAQNFWMLEDEAQTFRQVQMDSTDNSCLF